MAIPAYLWIKDDGGADIKALWMLKTESKALKY